MLSKKLDVANLPTPIHKLEHLSQRLGKEIYIKRDDYTGTEISGNKVRKLENTIQYVIDHGSDKISASGALSSKHGRASAALCAKYQRECHLVLKGSMTAFEGNLFLDAMFGAHTHVIADNQSRERAMTQLRHTLEGKNKTPLM